VKRVLNVGGGGRDIPIPSEYEGWEHVLLDIDPAVRPDVVWDARRLGELPGAQFEAVYCSHNLEHYFRHEARDVLRGMKHVLRPDGFAQIKVPDLGELFQVVAQKKLDIDDFLYQSAAGPITVRDVVYGYAVEIERSGNTFYAHKTGFTQRSLTQLLNSCGFPWVFSGCGNLEIVAIAFPQPPTEWATALFNLPPIGGQVS
jgi:hypothetical protein